jgi:hypothetical protein
MHNNQEKEIWRICIYLKYGKRVKYIYIYITGFLENTLKIAYFKGQKKELNLGPKTAVFEFSRFIPFCQILKVAKIADLPFCLVLSM